MKEFRTLTRLELLNMFGLNEFKYMKDPQGKRKKGILLIVFAVLGVMLLGYSMAGALGLRELDLTGKIPFLYFLVSFLVQMMLGAIKAKSQLYRERDMELLAGLPVKGLSIGAARMVRMYAEGILVWAGVFLPAMIVYGVDRQEDKLFFLMLIPVCLIAPILPVVFSAWVGIIFAAIIARTRHKVLIEVVLMLVVVIGMFILSAMMTSKTGFSGSSKGMSEAAKEKLTETVRDSIISMEEAVPPFKAASRAIAKTDIPGLLIYAAISIVTYILSAVVIGLNFFKISARLFTSSKHREYHLEAMKENSVMKALIKKESARYFSSGVYVSNTLVGPVLAVIMSVGAAFINMSKPVIIEKGASLTVYPAAGIPYILGSVLSFVSITASSVSIEGKNWWIPKSLPLSSKLVLNAKAAFNLIFLAPFFALSEIILVFTVKASLLERLWIVLLPLATVIYSVLAGLMLNLKFPKFKWETETEVVKQSAASGLGFVCIFPILILSSAAMVIPKEYRDLMNLGVFLILSGITLLLYRKINRVKLERIG